MHFKPGTTKLQDRLRRLHDNSFLRPMLYDIFILHLETLVHCPHLIGPISELVRWTRLSGKK